MVQRSGALNAFRTFGELLKYLRRRAQMTQQALGIATGYSEGQISRMESNQRVPDSATLHALFIPTLHLENEPETISRLQLLAEIARSRGNKATSTSQKDGLTAPSLPTGTVTFLFTDIQGSTPLWEQLPEAMKSAIKQHHAILNRAVTDNEGQVFQVNGDAFQAAFQYATQALGAALNAQRALQSALWGETGPIRVRMGLHAGPAEVDPHPGPGGVPAYRVSHTLNRAARVMSSGYGGQILLSEEAADLVRRALPPGAQLKDLGEHYLKGMEIPEHLYQVTVPDLPEDFPPLVSAHEPRSNLPTELTSLVGRETDLTEIANLLELPATRLLTLTGSGGCGKTRLALRIGHNLSGRFRHGIWLVELAPLSDPSQITQIVVTTLGLITDPNRLLLDTLMAFLNDRQVLLILDNCEHIINEAARLAENLLRGCPKLKILSTSREPLEVPGEVIYRVPSLALPLVSWGSSIELSAAEQLFLERAASTRPGYTLAEGEGVVLARICRLLDGIPLAIELAAARSALLPLSLLSARLEEGFRVLGSGSRGATPRHATLRAAVEWSYQLLSEPERVLLLKLPVFASGWSIEQAEEICAGVRLEKVEVLNLLASLVNKSLVNAERLSDGSMRYRMHEMVRQYARERLVEEGEESELRQRFIDFFLQLAEQAGPQLRGSQQLKWLARLDQENDNLIEALSLTISAADPIAALRLSAALTFYWLGRDRRMEGLHWITKALEKPPLGMPDSEIYLRSRARAILGIEFLLFFTFSDVTLQQYYNECIALFRSLGDRVGLSNALCFASFTQSVPDREAWVAELRALLPEMITTDEHWTAAAILTQLVEWERDQGHFTKRREYIELGIREMQASGDRIFHVLLLAKQCRLENEQGQVHKSRDRVAEILRFYAESGVRYEKGSMLFVLAEYEALLGNFDAVHAALREAERFIDEVGAFWSKKEIAAQWGKYYFLEGELTQARFLFDQLPDPFEEVRTTWFSGTILHNHALVLLYQGELEQSATKMAESQIIAERTLAHQDTFLRGIGRVRLAQGDLPAAHDFLYRSIAEFLRSNKLVELPETLDVLAQLALAEGRPERTAILLGASDGLFSRMEMKRYPVFGPEYDQCLVASRTALGDISFSQEYATGMLVGSSPNPIEAVYVIL